MSSSSIVVSMVEQLAQHFGFTSQEGRYTIGGLLAWSLYAMTEAAARDRGPDRMQSWSEHLENLGPQAPSE